MAPIEVETNRVGVHTASMQIQEVTAEYLNGAEASLWQSNVWKDNQEALGRDVRMYSNCHPEDIQRMTALIVIDRTKFGLTTWDIPRGPVCSSNVTKKDQEAFIQFLINESKKAGAISITFSPEEPIEALEQCSKPSGRHIYPEATRIVDLTKSEEEILSQMKQKGRYNIRLAERSAVSGQRSEDASLFHKLVQATSKRDAFIPHSLGHYQKFLELPGSFLLIATKDDTPIAGLIGVIHGDTGIYYYGASSYKHRSLMAPYLLQWEAMKYCKSQGCSQYDLFGIAPPDSPPDHPWSGITNFKEKFGGNVITYPKEHQIIHRPYAKHMLDLARRVRGSCTLTKS